MIVLAAFVLGCLVGWLRAARRGGTTADRLQYALAHGIPAGLAAVVLVTLGIRLGLDS